MENYTIYSTKEQTKKALELGAPIKRADILDDLKNQRYFFCDYGKIGAIVPTAEQMINWMESQDDIYDVRLLRTANGDWKYEITTKHIPKNKTYGRCKSKKEATLAAIDAALDYLINKKVE